MLPWLILGLLTLAALFSAPIFHPRNADAWKISGTLAAVAAALLVVLAVGRW